MAPPTLQLRIDRTCDVNRQLSCAGTRVRQDVAASGHPQSSRLTNGAIVLGDFSRCREYIPGRDEHGRDHRTDNKSVETEGSNSAQRGDKNDVVGHLCVFAHQDRTQEVIYESDDERTERYQSHALPDRTGHEKIEGNRDPDKARTYRGHQ